MTAPKSAAERKREQRARDKAAGVAEVTGIRAKLHLHEPIKDSARKIIAEDAAAASKPAKPKR